MSTQYEDYQTRVISDIHTCIEEMGCQPILFIGSGVSRRYFNAPNWEQLLEIMASNCPEVDRDFAYYKQKYDKDYIKIGDIFSECYREWAWGSGRSNFSDELFKAEMPSSIYLKQKVVEFFTDITPDDVSKIKDSGLKRELDLLKKIRPHAIITTNYDQFLKTIFPDFETIIGQSILKQSFSSVGELFKIHGCVSEPDSLVLTSQDYDEFIRKKKYLSAKLLTYFAEHPLIFIGYRAEDPNIKSILSDIDELLSPDNDLVSNIYIVTYDKKITSESSPPFERLISISADKSIRLKNITTNQFDWVFEALSSNPAIEKVNPKLLRAILARTFDLVRYDFPKKAVQVDYQILEHAVENHNELSKFYGLTTLEGPSSVNATHIYSLTKIGKMLEFNGWYQANELIKAAEEKTGYNIKSSDNKYHVAVKVGDKSIFHKYSDLTYDLLRKVRDGEEYDVEI